MFYAKIMGVFIVLIVFIPKCKGTSSQVRRINAEWKDIVAAGLSMSPRGDFTEMGNSTDPIRLMPHPLNVLEWHFTFAGAPETDYEYGLYHGKVILPPDYPNSAPSVRLLTPNGRFKVNARICLSASEFHQETWNPSWTIRTLVTALRSHMISPSEEIGSIQSSRSTRLLRARQSRQWKCSVCMCDHSKFPVNLFPVSPSFESKFVDKTKSRKRKSRQDAESNFKNECVQQMHHRSLLRVTRYLNFVVLGLLLTLLVKLFIR